MNNPDAIPGRSKGLAFKENYGMNKQLIEMRKSPHWSFSSLNAFLNICSLKWAFGHYYDLEPESTSVNLVFGSAFHAAASWLAERRKEGVYPGSEDLFEVFNESWTWECRAADNLVLSAEEMKEFNELGRKMMETLNNQWLEDDVVNVGRAFSVRLPGSAKPLIGEIDLIVKDDSGRVTLVDWKTSARKWSDGKADKDLQATCFSHAWREMTGESAPFRYDVVTKTKTPAYVQYPTFRSEDDFQRLSKLVEMVERAVEAEVFLPAEQSFFCGSCEYKSACREWHGKSAGTLQLPFARAA